LFGGYQKYQIWSENTPWRQLQLAGSAIAKRKLRTAWWMLRRASRSFCDDKAFWLDHVQYYPPQGIRQLTHPDMHPYANAFAPAFDEPFLNIDKLGRFEYAQRMDLLSYLPDCLLAKVDLASMAHGLEVRPALLDKYVFQLAATLPTDVKLHPQKGGKVVLKELLLRQGFSEEFVYRPKQGFALPLRHWFISGQPANNMLCELVSSYKRELSEHLTVSDIERMLTAHSPACDYSGPLWLAFAFTCWVANTSK
jgi:asparagine synthase (glutamine-hydrolysing)